MKNRIVIAAAMLLVAAGIAFAQGVARSAVFVKLNSSTGSSEQFTNATTLVSSAMVIGKKSLTATNTSAVRIGWATNTTYFVINPGQAYIIEFPDRRQFRLSELYFDVETANDGVVVSYE